MHVFCKKLLKVTGVTAVLLSLTTGKANSQNKFDTLLTRHLQALFVSDSLPGLSVVLVNTKGIIYQNNFGFSDVQNKIPFSNNTVQNIGSVSKTFIAVAAMKAIELGYFSLETDINDILPFKVVNPNAINGKITVRELTVHSSGIIDNPSVFPNTYKFYPGLRPYDQYAYDTLKKLGYQQKVTDTSMKQFFFDYLSPNGKYYSSENFGKGMPGTACSYSNIGSALVAYLIEVKSGMSYADFTEKYILKPLKMTNSGWTLDRDKLAIMAKPYYDQTRNFPMYSSITYPDGGLRTCTADLSKYIIAMLNGYQGNSAILNEGSFKTMFTKQFSEKDHPSGIKLTFRNKGIFWNIYTNGNIGHDGDDPGVSTFLFFNPTTGLGGVFICNKYLPNKQPYINILWNAANQIAQSGE